MAELFQTIFFIIISLFYSQSAICQTSFKGKVIDSKKRIIPFANVILLSAKDSSMLAWTATDTLGSFQLKNSPNYSDLLIQAGCLGFKTLTKPLSQTKRTELVIVLDEKETLLNEIQVAGNNNQHMNFGNKGLTIRIEDSPYTVFSTAIDMIQQLPLLSYDNDELKVLDRTGTPLLYINSRKVSDIQKELEILRTEDIKTINIILNPGVEYPSDITSVIRITTKTNRNKGLFGSASIFGKYGKVPSYNSKVNLDWQKNGFNVYLNGYYSNSQSKQNQSVSQEIMSLKSFEEIHSDIHYTFETINYSIGVDYTKNEDLQFGTQYELYKRPKINSELHSHDTLYIGDDLHDLGYSEAYSTENSIQHHGNLYVHFKQDKQNFNITFNIVSGNNQEDNSSSLSYWLMNKDVNSSNKSDYLLTSGKIIHITNVLSGQLQSGSELNTTNHNNNYKMLSDETNISSSQNEIDQKSLSFFTTYSKSLNKLHINAGGRWDYYKYQYKVITNSTSDDYIYTSFSPLLSLDYHIDSKYSMSLGYKRVVKRPSYYALRNSVSFISPYLYEGGNPYLKDCYQDRVYWNLNAGSIYAELHYTSSCNFHSLMFSQYVDSEYIIVVKPDNISALNALSALVSSKLEINNLSMNMSVMLQKQYIRYMEQNYNDPYARFSLKATYKHSKSFNISLKANYNTAGNVRITQQESNYKCNLYINKDWCHKKLHLSLFVYDIFNSSREYWSVDINNINMIKRNRKDSQQIGLRISYNLGTSKSKYGGSTHSSEIDRL